MKKVFFLHFEWMALVSFLIIPAFIDPAANSATFCLFHNIGIEFCPGCGLGRSVAYLFRGDLTASFHMHPAGWLAVVILASRVAQIFNRNRKIKKYNVNEKDI